MQWCVPYVKTTPHVGRLGHVGFLTACANAVNWQDLLEKFIANLTVAFVDYRWTLAPDQEILS